MSTIKTHRALSAARLRPYAVLLALGAAFLAQAALDRSALRYGAATLGLFLLAAGLLAAFSWRDAVESANIQPYALRPVPGWRRVLAAFAVPASMYAWYRLANNRFTWDGALAWAAAVVCLLVSAYQPPAQPRKRSGAGLHLDWIQLALLGAVAVGAFLRLWRLEEIPAEMGCDLPLNFNNVQGILNGDTSIFFTSWPGREGLLFYLAALPSALFGLSHWTIKLTTALIGIATIPAIYLLGKELYERELGLIAAWLYAASHWAIITSRLGLRMALVPLLLTLTLYFFIRGLHRASTWHLALAGLFLGLGMHSYNAFIAVPPLLCLWLLLEVILGRGRRLWQMRLGFGYLLVIALVIFLPLGRFMLDYPGQYLLRVTTRITGSEAALPANPLWVFLQNVVNAVLMFNVAGDRVSYNNIAGFRQLSFVAAALLPLGGLHLLLHPKRGHNLTLLATLLFMLMPTALSIAFPNEVPGAGRAIGALTPAIITSALALDLIRRALSPQPRTASAGVQGYQTGTPTVFSVFAPRSPAPMAAAPATSRRKAGMRRWFAWALVVLLLGYEAVAAYPTYFNAYRLNLPDQNYSISLEMARVMDDFAGNGEVFIKTQGNWYDGNAVRAQLRKLPGWDNEFWELDLTKPPLVGTSAKVLVILHPADQTSLEALRAAFSHSVAVTHFYYDGREAFIAFYEER